MLKIFLKCLCLLTTKMMYRSQKAKNFVRFYDGRYRLVDFDQSRKAGG